MMKFILSLWAIQNRPQDNKPAHGQKETRRPDPAGRPASKSLLQSSWRVLRRGRVRFLFLKDHLVVSPRFLKINQFSK